MVPTSAPPIEVALFLSWAHADDPLKTDLLGRLEPNLKILGGVSFLWWEDSQIRLGTLWREDISGRLDECDYGLQLLSPAFFASDVITGRELPPFVGPDPVSPCLPVGLRHVPLDGTRVLHGLDARQIFLYEGRFYNELSGHKRDAFASGLATEIWRRVTAQPVWRRV